VLSFFEGRPPCLVGLEACASAHHWGREIEKLGHEVRLMPPQYVRPYVKRNKNDATDAEAICEAVTRPTMRFVPIKSIEQQAVLMLHRSRDLLIRQRTALVNALRGHFAELGIVVGQGIQNVAKLVEKVTAASLERVPVIARAVLEVLVNQLSALQQQIRFLEAELLAWHRANAASQRLATIPGGVGNRRHRNPRDAISFGTGVLGLDRVGATTAFERRQAAARWDQQARRRLSSAAPDPRCTNRPALAAGPRGRYFRLGARFARPPAPQHRRRGDRQQDGTHRLGHVGPR
jgi:hypothetical protein